MAWCYPTVQLKKHREGKKATNLVKISLIDQLVKNLPAMQETLVRFLGWEDPLKKG